MDVRVETQRGAFDRGRESPYDGQVGLRCPAPCCEPDQCGLKREPLNLRLLPPRSMAGQLPLEQPIGVRIPGGQPKYDSKRVTRSSIKFAKVLRSSSPEQPKPIIPSKIVVTFRAW